jgi:hypothetical protein
MFLQIPIHQQRRFAFACRKTGEVVPNQFPRVHPMCFRHRLPTIGIPDAVLHAAGGAIGPRNWMQRAANAVSKDWHNYLPECGPAQRSCSLVQLRRADLADEREAPLPWAVPDGASGAAAGDVFGRPTGDGARGRTPCRSARSDVVTASLRGAPPRASTRATRRLRSPGMPPLRGSRARPVRQSARSEEPTMPRARALTRPVRSRALSASSTRRTVRATTRGLTNAAARGLAAGHSAVSLTERRRVVIGDLPRVRGRIECGDVSSAGTYVEGARPPSARPIGWCATAAHRAVAAWLCPSGPVARWPRRGPVRMVRGTRHAAVIETSRAASSRSSPTSAPLPGSAERARASGCAADARAPRGPPGRSRRASSATRSTTCR